jgi:DNA-binding NtrC family response regulator
VLKFKMPMGEGPSRIRSGTRTRPGRVLVVDDRAKVGDELSMELRDHEVHAVECGEDALALIEAGERYDLILSDVVMQGMSGVELLASLEKSHLSQAKRVVFMVDALVSPVVERLLEGVPNLLIQKPLDLEGLRSLLERRIVGAADAKTA